MAFLAAYLQTVKTQFINDFVSFSADTRFSEENAEKLFSFLVDPKNHKIGSTEIADGIKVNIDWTKLKDEKDVYPEVHHRYHDIHIPTFNEGMYLFSAGANLIEHKQFQEAKDIGFYQKPETAKAILISQNSWRFVPKGVYHGPLYNGFINTEENFFEGEFVVKICVKILAD